MTNTTSTQITSPEALARVKKDKEMMDAKFRVSRTFDKDQPFESTFTDKDTTRGTWTMTFKDWSDFHSYVGQKSHIIESYHLSQS